MQIKAALTLYKLIRKVSESPLLDAELLLAHVLNKPREFLYTYPENNISAKEYQQFKKLILKRAEHYPLAYLTGHKEFYGLDFLVNKSVLIPRPETEEIIDHVIKITHTCKTWGYFNIADIGTGSGNIAIAIKKYLPRAKVLATDISQAALKIAKINAKNILGKTNKITFYSGSLLKALPKKYFHKLDLIVANLPYLPNNIAQKKTLSQEPRVALTPPQGKNQYYWINKMLLEAPQYLKPSGKIILERKDGEIVVYTLDKKNRACESVKPQRPLH